MYSIRRLKSRQLAAKLKATHMSTTVSHSLARLVILQRAKTSLGPQKLDHLFRRCHKKSQDVLKDILNARLRRMMVL